MKSETFTAHVILIFSVMYLFMYVLNNILDSQRYILRSLKHIQTIYQLIMKATLKHSLYPWGAIQLFQCFSSFQFSKFFASYDFNTNPYPYKNLLRQSLFLFFLFFSEPDLNICTHHKNMKKHFHLQPFHLIWHFNMFLYSCAYLVLFIFLPFIEKKTSLNRVQSNRVSVHVVNVIINVNVIVNSNVDTIVNVDDNVNVNVNVIDNVNMNVNVNVNVNDNLNMKVNVINVFCLINASV